MEELYIEFSVQGLNPLIFYLDFIQKYERFNSDFFPVFVRLKKIPAINYLVLEANEDPLREPREIAKMTFLDVDNEKKVLIEWIGEDRSKWYTVEKIAKSVLEDLWNKGYLINSVFPPGLFHHSKIGQTKAEMVGKGIHIEGELITEESKTVSGFPNEGDQSDLERSELSNPIIGVPKKLETNLPDLSLNNDVIPSGNIPKYGTDRNLTENDIKSIVVRFLWFKTKYPDTTLKWYFEEGIEPRYQDKFSFEALRSYLKNSRFKPKKL